MFLRQRQNVAFTKNNLQPPRNVPDDVLQMVAEKGGIVMVNFFPYFLTDDYPARNATVQVHKRASCSGRNVITARIFSRMWWRTSTISGQ